MDTPNPGPQHLPAWERQQSRLPTDSLSDSPPIKLFRGDHLLVLPALPQGSVDLICTSPNYNVGKVYGGDVDGDRLPLWAYKQNLTDLLSGCQHVLRFGGVLAMVVPPAINIQSTDGQRLFFTADFDWMLIAGGT